MIATSLQPGALRGSIGIYHRLWEDTSMEIHLESLSGFGAFHKGRPITAAQQDGIESPWTVSLCTAKPWLRPAFASVFLINPPSTN